MAINLGSAYGKVSIDASGVQSGVATAKNALTELSSVGMRLGADMQKIGAAMTIAISAPLVLMGKSALQMGMQLNDAKENVKLVFGDMTDAVLKWSQGSADAMALSQRAALQSAAQFGMLFTNVGLTQQAAVGMSEKFVQLARDISEFNGEDINTTLAQLQSGLVGRGMELKKFGVDLSDATVSAKAMAMGLADANGQVSEAAKVQARYQLILEGTAKVQGLFASKTNDASKDTEILKAKLETAMETLGTRMIPIYLKVVDALIKLVDIFLKLPEPVQNGILILAGLAVVMGPVITMMGTVVSMIFSIVGIVGMLQEAGISLAMIGTAIGTVVTALGAVLLPIILIVGAVALLYWAFSTNFGGIRTAAVQLWFILKYEFKNGWESIKSSTDAGLKNLGKSMVEGTEGAGSKMKAAWKQIGEDISGLWSYYLGLIDTRGDYMNDQLMDVPKKLRPFAMALGQIFGDALRTYDALNEAFQLETRKMVIGMQAAFKDIYAIWRYFGDSIKIHDYLNDWLVDIPMRFHPLVMAVGAGLQTMSYAYLYFQNTIKTGDFLNQWLHDLPGNLQPVALFFGQTIARVQAIFTGFGTWLHTAWQNLMTWLGTMAASARDWIVSAFNIDWYSVGMNIINGIINGILAGINSLIAAAQAAAQAALDAIKSTLGISSPSMAAFKLGSLTSQGYMLGVNAGMDPNKVAAMLARPLQGNGIQQQNLSLTLSGAVTYNQMRQAFAENNEQLLNAFGGMFP